MAATLGADSSRNNYDLAFQICPIILSGGIAGNQGRFLPITSLWGNPAIPLAKFLPLPGSKLVSQTIGMYPFANQAVAANATIQQPLTISLVMLAPVNQPGGYLTKLHTFQALAASLAQHNAIGGTYNVATPAFIFYNCVMLDMTDISQEGDEKQVQIEWQLDFMQPLITQQALANAQNNTMQKITAGSQLTPNSDGVITWSGNQAASTAAYTGVTAALAAFGGNPPAPASSQLPSAGQPLSGNPSGGNVA